MCSIVGLSDIFTLFSIFISWFISLSSSYQSKHNVVNNYTFGSGFAVIVFVDVADGFSPCSPIKQLSQGHAVRSHCFFFDVTLTSWEEEETQEEEDSSRTTGTLT